MKPINMPASHPISVDTTPIQSPRATKPVEQVASDATLAGKDTFERITDKIPSSETVAETVKQDAEAVKQNAETAAIETRSFLARAWDNISQTASAGGQQFLQMCRMISNSAFSIAESIINNVYAFFKKAEATAKTEASELGDVAQDGADVVEAKIDDARDRAEDVVNA